jgi:hypothetical protein
MAEDGGRRAEDGGVTTKYTKGTKSEERGADSGGVNHLLALRGTDGKGARAGNTN